MFKPLGFTTVTAALLMGSTALANPLLDQVIAQLEEQGFTIVEIERYADAFEVEAEMDGMEREVVVNLAGEVIKDELSVDDDDDDEAEGSGSDDDDDDEDDDRGGDDDDGDSSDDDDDNDDDDDDSGDDDDAGDDSSDDDDEGDDD